VAFFVYIRIKYPFWAVQPVFHFYDIYYWFVNVGIIRHELPKKNRYTNFLNIKCKEFTEIDEATLQQVTSLLQWNYLRDKESQYLPKKENIVPYFVGHNGPCICSYYETPEVYINNKTGATINEREIIGVITGRPLHVVIPQPYQKEQKIKMEMDVYYVDFLCVDKKWRKKNIAPQLIQTHEYMQCHKNHQICVSLFKREGEMTGIIPLTCYQTYCFHMRNWLDRPVLPGRITLLTGNTQNMYYMYNFIQETVTKWDILIYPAISNMMELVKTGNIYIKMLVIDKEIEAVYIFRKTCTYIGKDTDKDTDKDKNNNKSNNKDKNKSNKEIISCMASVQGKTIEEKDFIQGFKVALTSILLENKEYMYLCMEDVSDSRVLIDNLRIKTAPMVVSPTAYFFYNFAYNTFQANKCFIIN